MQTRSSSCVLSLVAKHALTRSVLEQYRPRKLWTVVAFLQYEEHDTDAKMCHKLLAQLRKFLQLRMKPMAPHPSDPVNVIRLEWTSRLLRYIPLRQILEDEQVASLLPAGAEGATDQVVIARRLTAPIGRKLLNFSKVARQLDEEYKSSDNCPCRQLFDHSFRPGGGCVLTG